MDNEKGEKIEKVIDKKGKDANILEKMKGEGWRKS